MLFGSPLPLEYILKLNFDGAVSAEGAAATFIIRDYQGRLLKAAGRQLSSCSVAYAELDILAWKAVSQSWNVSHIFQEANQVADWFRFWSIIFLTTCAPLCSILDAFGVTCLR